MADDLYFRRQIWVKGSYGTWLLIAETRRYMNYVMELVE